MRDVLRRLTKPFFNEKIDRFLILGFAFFCFFSFSYVHSIGFTFLEIMILAILALLALSFILRLMGNKWRKNKGLDD